MKKQFYRTALLLVFGSALTGASAQNDLSSFLKTGVNDGEKLVNAYASPLLKSMGAGMNAGWFNTAKPHGLGGFDITVAPNVIFAPSSDKSFNVNDLGLQSLRLTSSNNSDGQTATFFGSKPQGPQIGFYTKSPYTQNDTAFITNNLPGGIGTNIFAVPTAQIAVGVGFGTEVLVRFLPQVTIGDVKMNMLGFGIKHDFKQWIPVMKNLPFDLSAMFAYTKMDAELKTNMLTAEPSSSTTYNGNPGKSYSQRAEFNSSAYVFNVLISKKIAMFTPYLGLGYQTATTTLGLKGEYPITDVNTGFEPNNASGTPGYDPNNPNHHPKIVKIQTDPVSVEGTLSGFRATAGFRLKMAVITLHADYTLAQYQVVSAGLGINIQQLVPFKL